MGKLALYGLTLGAAMAVGTAQAEPLTLAADQMDQVTAAGEGFATFDASLFKNIEVNKNVDIQKIVEKFQFIDVFGFFGEADAFANCSDGGTFGCQAVTEAFTDAVTETGTVTSVSLAESAASHGTIGDVLAAGGGAGGGGGGGGGGS
jgi:hypothetical protein